MKQQFKVIIVIISNILGWTGKYFESYNKRITWEVERLKIDQNNEYFNSLSGQVKFRLGILICIALFILCVDYASIHQFIEGLVANAGGLIGFILSIIGLFLFFSLEILAGLILINSKKEDSTPKVFLGIVLGLIVCAIPAFLVWETYDITPDEDKTTWLYSRTIAYMALSFVMHLLLFICIKSMIDALQWCWYGVSIWWKNIFNPLHAMKRIRKELIKEFTDFNRNYNHFETAEDKRNATTNMNNRAWYLLKKLSDGDRNDYDLRDYNENIDYSPFVLHGYAKTISVNENQTVGESKSKVFEKNSTYTHTVS